MTAPFNESLMSSIGGLGVNGQISSNPDNKERYQIGLDEAMKELGQTGLRQTSGVVHEEFLPKLAGRMAAKTYQEMETNDPLIGAILYAFKGLITQVEWRVDPSDENSSQSMEVADFVESCLHDMEQTWPNTIEEILSMLPYGWSYHEVVYKKRDDDNSRHADGKIGWAKMPIRSQETLNRWVIDEKGAILGMVQQTMDWNQLVFIPSTKALLFRTSVHKNNPEGRSLLRNAYRPWYYKKRIEEIEAIGIERDLAGLPVMSVPVSIMRSDAKDWEKAIRADCEKIVVNIRRDEQEGVLIPMMFDEDGNQLMRLELLSAGGSRQFDTSGIIERYDRRIAMTVLADFILLGHETVGSFALSSDKTDIFAVTLGAVLRKIRDTIQNDAIPQLLALNGISKDLTPKLEFGDIEKQPLSEVVAYVQGLVAAGVPLFPDEKLSKYLLGLGNLPVPEHDLDQNISSPDALSGSVSPQEPIQQSNLPETFQDALTGSGGDSGGSTTT